MYDARRGNASRREQKRKKWETKMGRSLDGKIEKYSSPESPKT